MTQFFRIVQKFYGTHLRSRHPNTANKDTSAIDRNPTDLVAWVFSIWVVAQPKMSSVEFLNDTEKLSHVNWYMIKNVTNHVVSVLSLSRILTTQLMPRKTQGRWT